MTERIQMTVMLQRNRISKHITTLVWRRALWVTSHGWCTGPMSPCGYKQTLWSAAWSIRFTPKTRHQRRHVCFPLKSRSRLLEAPYSAISGCLAFGDSGGKIALSGLEIGVGAVPFPPILGRQWPSCRAEPDGRPQRSPGFASARPVPSPGLPQGRAG